MPVSANIFQQYLKAPKSVNDYRAEMDTAEAGQNALATAAMEAKARQQAMQDEEAYRGAVSASGGDQNALIKALNAQGLGTRAQAVQKSMLDAEKTRAGIDVDKSTAGKNTQATEQAAQQAHIQAAGMIQTPEDAVSWAAEAVRKGIMTPQQFQTGLARIPNDPAGMQQWKSKVQQGGMTVLQQLSSVEPKPTEVKLGNVVKFLDMNPRSPTFGKEVAPAQQMGQSPDSIASNRIQIRGQNMSDARSREFNAISREGIDSKRQQDTEMKLADDWRAQSKNYKDVNEAAKRVTSALETATTSPAATLAAATSFMKLLDPGSVVRESELGMALQASGVFDRATNYFNVLQKGKVLTPTQAADFKNITKKIYGAAQAAQRDVDSNYQNQARTYKLRPEMIVQDLGQGKTFEVNGERMEAQRAPDGKYYIQQGGKYFEVRD